MFPSGAIELLEGAAMQLGTAIERVRAEEALPDVVVMDINMADVKGGDAAVQMISSTPGIKLIALSIYSNRQFVEKMLKV